MNSTSKTSNTPNRTVKKRLIPVLAAALLGSGTLAARDEYREIARLASMNERVYGIRSMADGEHYTTLEGNEILRYSYAQEGPGERLLPRSSDVQTVSDYTFSPDERMILIASGRTPIYRHSYSTCWRPTASSARSSPRPRPRATPPSRPTGG